jgi:hypothetical protein
MPLHSQPRATAAPATPSISTPAEARKLADVLLEAMDALLAVIERETTLVKAGRIADALTMEKQKAELSGRYAAAISVFKASHAYMSRATPDLLTGLHRHHEAFRAMLQINLTVLATAHAVSEGIIRGVNAEIQRRRSPSTYNARGGRTAPSPRLAAPLAVSRKL